MFVKIPVKIKFNDRLIDNYLMLEIIIGNTDYTTTKKFSITIEGKEIDIIAGEALYMDFESQLIALQRKLPEGHKIISCLFCALSHYHVAGNDKFGTLICYREIKNEILKVDNKSDYYDVTLNKGFNVQEIFYCPEFTEITQDTWVYKDKV